MSLRRKTPTDMAGVKRSRSSLMGKVTAASVKIKTIKHDDPAEIIRINSTEIKRILASLEKTEAGFEQSLEEAMDFVPSGEDQEDTFYEEEETAKTQFEEALNEVKDQAKFLIELRKIWVNTTDLSTDVKALETNLEHGENCMDFRKDMETTIATLREQCNDLSLSTHHSVKEELEACTLRLGTLRLQASASVTPSILSSTLGAAPATSAKIGGKLPPIVLPTFMGDIMDWSNFWMKFSDLVDKKEELSTTTKLTYLKQAIKDPAAQVMLNSPTEGPETYKNLIKSLHQRYERTKKIHRDLVAKMDNLPDAKNTSNNLRKLVDDTTAYMASIKQTGHFTLETFVTSMIYSRLPYKVKLDWDDHHADEKVVAPYNKLLDFVSNRAYSLADNLPVSTKNEPSARKQEKPADKKQHNNQTRRANVHVATTPAPWRSECLLCPSERHALYQCPKWLKMTYQQRLDQAKARNLCHLCLAPGHTTDTCRSKYKCHECRLPHSITLHPPQSPLVAVVSPELEAATMMTAQVLLTGPRGNSIKARAMIDPGAAISLITSKAAQQLNLPLTKANLRFSGVSGAPCKPAKHCTEMEISNLEGTKTLQLKAAVVPIVTELIPAQEMAPIDDLPHLAGLTLADPTFHIPGQIDILLGAKVFVDILTKQMVKGFDGEPAAMETIFGWAIVGAVRSLEKYNTPIPVGVALLRPEDQILTDHFQQYWTSEQPEEPIRSISSIEQEVQQLYSKDTVYDSEKKLYTVKLPWDTAAPSLGESRAQALKRFHANEASMDRKGKLTECHEVIQNYLDLEHAELIPASEPLPTQHNYLPYHYVMKQSSTTTKIRAVFDGSAITSSGVSLNNSLLVGPTLHPTLVRILLKFRHYPVAITADISKMYRAVELDKEARDVHRFLWRPDKYQAVQDYRMTRVTFGISASPYLAVRTLQQTAIDHGSKFPEATKHILSSFYVDDLIAGAATEEEASRLYNEIRQILEKGGFNICKWRSSSASVLHSIPTELQEKLHTKEVKNEHHPNQPKALGLEWDSDLDCMSPCISPPGNYVPTKRGIAADVAKTFDAMGWIAPTTILMKMLQQKLWQLKISWDDDVPPDIKKLHKKWRKQLPLLTEMKIPRCYVRKDAIPLTIELQGFADASKVAQGAVVYLRSTYDEHPPLMSLVCAKTKVTPLKIAAEIERREKEATKDKKNKHQSLQDEDEEPYKDPSIHKLELSAAELLSNLLVTVQEVLDIPDDDVHAWSDSSTVLSWLDGRPKDYKVYVTNRINLILKRTKPQTWLYVPTKSNPADCASRGMMPADLLTHKLWWEGPEWMKEEPYKIPHQPPRKPLAAPEQRTVSCNMVQLPPVPDLERQFTDYHKLLTTTAWCLKFIGCLTHARPPDPGKEVKLLTAAEVKQAEHFLVKRSQARTLAEDHQALSHGKEIPTNSRLKALAPYLDGEKLLRVGGRLSHSNLTISQQHPLIVDGKDILVRILFAHVHLCLAHCGPSLLLSATGSRFHVLGARKLSRAVCNQCTKCRRTRPHPQPQQMGQLPVERTSPSPAFQSTGMDFAGPFTIKMGYTRKPVHLKAHICIFICFSTRAIHLEVISDEKTDAFLAGMDRFVARRGRPHTIWSDNGPNFVGAKNRLNKLYQLLTTKEAESSIHQHLLRNRIEWKNSPARSPNFGGLWEAAVRSMKYHLKRVMGPLILSFKELTTVACQVEACLNSRPILAINSHNDDGISTLTSGHFLMMKPPTAYPSDPSPMKEPNLSTKWKMCQAIIQHFWSRWHREYLQTLQARTKWTRTQPNLQEGDIVVLKEDKLFTCHWPIAKIIKTYPGSDGLVRVALIKTSTSTFKRPVNKLALLHREEELLMAPPGALPPGACLSPEDKESSQTAISDPDRPDHS